MSRSHTKPYIRELYESFIRIRGVFITFLALCLGLLYFFLSGNTATIALRAVLPVIVALVIIAATLFDLSIRLHGKATKQLPRVMQARKPPTLYPNAIAILLIEESEIFGHESIVSVYYRDDGFEVLIGIGFVLTKQDDGLIQVVVNRQVEEAHKEVWTKVCQNDTNTLPRLLVKPSMPKLILEE